MGSDQRFSTFHGLWTSSKDSHHLRPSAHQEGFAISRQSYLLFSKCLCLWPPENRSVAPKASRGLWLRNSELDIRQCFSVIVSDGVSRLGVSLVSSLGLECLRSRLGLAGFRSRSRALSLGTLHELFFL